MCVYAYEGIFILNEQLRKQWKKLNYMQNYSVVKTLLKKLKYENVWTKYIGCNF